MANIIKPSVHHEKVDLSLFKIVIDGGDYFNEITSKLLEDSITKCSIDIENFKLYLSFDDNIYSNNEKIVNEMFVYTKLLFMKYKKNILPSIKIFLHNEKGDIYLEYILEDITLNEFTDIIQLSKIKNYSDNYLSINSSFLFNFYTINFHINQDEELNINTITNKDCKEDYGIKYIKNI